MAEIGDEFNVHRVHPKIVGQYSLSFTKEEEEGFDYLSNHENQIKDGSHKPGPEPNFYIGYADSCNPINRMPVFANLKEKIKELTHHYCTVVMGFQPPEDIRWMIADSWIVELNGDASIPPNEVSEFRKHNHSFSMLSGVIYLEDSKNGLNLCAEPTHNEFYPWVFREDEENFNAWSRRSKFHIQPRKGDVWIFPAVMSHELVQGPDVNDRRRSVVFNIWPVGDLCSNPSSSVRMQDLLEELKDVR